MGSRFLVSAGEASGDRYCAGLTQHLRSRLGEGEFFGCAGREMQAAGVRPVVDASSLAVVGISEVVVHIPRIYGEYRKMIAAARGFKPDVAILTDSPDFHLRLAPHLRQMGIPVVYLVAPQVWAWREGRIGTLRRNVTELHCIFPFEEQYFRDRGVTATYIGHPLSRLVRAHDSKAGFLHKHRLSESKPLVVVCPGSRRGEMARHRRLLEQTAAALHRSGCEVVAAVPPGSDFPASPYWQVASGDTWSALAHADAGLLASGTVTVEAALLGLPFVSFYQVSPLSWTLGRRLVRAPFLTMVNLVAGEKVVEEWIQEEATPERLSSGVLRLLDDQPARARVKQGLERVAGQLRTPHDPLDYSARLIVERIMRK
ncbi:MAG: lipid-A-disaccharide synthase [Bryobacterales bacterium]|nr:lipid-A-disaccharide synthase [Bryobacterales bacterium]